MSLLIIGGQKGGTGKSTIATNLAVAFQRAGRQVLLVDSDRQLTASNWGARRQEDETLQPITCVQKTGKLYQELIDLSGRYDDVIVDAGGFDSVELRTALVAADVIYSPVKATQNDLWTLEAMTELVEQARDLNKELRAFLVLSIASTNPAVSSTRDALELLRQYPAFAVCGSVLHNRKAYEDSGRDGKGVLEMADRKAVAEFSAFSTEVFQHVGIQQAIAEAS